MIIAVLGNSHFAPIIIERITKFDTKNTYIYYNTSEKQIDKIKFLLKIPFIDIVYSISASIKYGGALGIALFFNKKIVQHFIGTDVLTAIEDYTNKNYSKKLMNRSKYLSEVDWIQTELMRINIETTISSIAAVNKKNCDASFSNKFIILGYMAENYEDFYGLDYYIKLAEKFPDINIRVMGIKKSKKKLPKNIILLGWIKDTKTEFLNSILFLRLTVHDGLPFSVIESLSYSRYVAMTNKFPYTTYIQEYKELEKYVGFLKTKFSKNELEINRDGAHFVSEEYLEEKVIKSLIHNIIN